MLNSGQSIFEFLFGNDVQVDNERVLTFLDTRLTSNTAARSLQEQISRECRGTAIHLSVGLVDNRSQVHVDANNLFAQKNYAEALKKYQEALNEQPRDHRLYTNAALCHFKMDNFRDAIVNASVPARFLNKKWIKAQQIVVSSQCCLGYYELAGFYHDKIAPSLTQDELRAIEGRIINHCKTGTARSHRADVADFIETTCQMATSKKPEEVIYLLYHCLFHLDVGSYPASQIEEAVNIIERVHFLRNLPKNNQIDLAALSAVQRHLLCVFVTFIAEFTKVSSVVAEKVMKQQQFVGFLVKLAKYFTSKEGIRGTLRLDPFGELLFIHFIKLLVSLITNKSTVPKRILGSTAPFNSIEWLSNFSVSAFCIVSPDNNLLTDIECAPYLLLKFCEEPNFYEQFNNIKNAHKKAVITNGLDVLSLLSYFDYRPFNNSQSFVRNWINLTRNELSAAFCVTRPCVWSYVVRRLAQFTEPVNQQQTPDINEISLSLTILSNLMESVMILPSSNSNNGKNGNKAEHVDNEFDDRWNGNRNVPALMKSLSTILKFEQDFRNIQEDESKQIIDKVFRLLAHFSQKSFLFSQALASARVDFFILETVDAALAKHDSAAYYFAVISGQSDSNALFRSRLVASSQFDELIRRLAMFASVDESELLKINSILCLTNLLLASDKCKNAVFQTLSIIDNRALVRQLSMLIRNHDTKAHLNDEITLCYERILAISAGQLLSLLVQLDDRLVKYEEEIRDADEDHLSDVLRRVVDAAR